MRSPINRFTIPAILRYVGAFGAGWLALSVCVHAQMLSAVGARMYAPSSGESGRFYEVEYRQVVVQDFSVSFDYLNEGHVTSHHRDGYGFQGWYRIRLLPENKLSVLVGAGPYYYFDTQTFGNSPSADVHDTAFIGSLSLQGHISSNLFWMATANWIRPSHDFTSVSGGIGLGYWLGRQPHEANVSPTELGFLDTAERGKRLNDDENANEITLFGVESVINVSSNPKSWGVSAEYRHRFFDNLDGTVSYIYEGDPKVARRSGLAVEGWPVRTGRGRWLKNLDLGLGFGPYFFLDRKNRPLPGQSGAAFAAGMVSAMVSYDLCDRTLLRFVWDRVITSYNRDADIWRIGFGYRFGH